MLKLASWGTFPNQGSVIEGSDGRKIITAIKLLLFLIYFSVLNMIVAF